jgi:hypothetical protein
MSVSTRRVSDRARSNWSNSLVLFSVTAAAVVLTYYALIFGPDDDQLIRFGLWVGATITSIAALVYLFITLDGFDVKLSRAPSTYLSVGAMLSAVIFVVMRGDAIQADDLDLAFTDLSNSQMVILAVALRKPAFSYTAISLARGAQSSFKERAPRRADSSDA